ncbi:MAG: replicative DNA helicase [Prevotellaceae bacterium]|jgi:replicative DNA helicase|nr:replicative DNA helicase [Prevotellaceae bacterium]
MTERTTPRRWTKKQEVNVTTVGLELGKVPPQALDLEAAVLGAAMLEKDAVVDVLDILKPESFYKDAHQKIFRAISALSHRLEPIDIYTVTQELRKENMLDEVGGAQYLSSLTLKVGSAANIDYHAKIIAQKYIQRELIRISSEVQRRSFDDATDVEDLLDSAQQDILTLAEGNIKREAQPVSNVVDKVMKNIEEASKREDGFSGVPTGFTDLDRLTQGWQPSDLIIIAARPAMGKTAFVLSMARNMAIDHKRPVAFFSLEMASEQLVTRLFMSESGFSGDKLRSGRLDQDEMQQLSKSIRPLLSAPMFIDDTPGLGIFEFRSKARRLYTTHNIQCIIIDYLQLMSGPPETRGFREQEVAAISRSLKAIAKELNIPIIALSQLNRSVETRVKGNMRPVLSDLRESGAIEQDADIVAFIHRPEYYDIMEDSNGSTIGMADILVAKHRNGAVDDVRLRFRAAQAKFTNLEDDQLDNLQPAAPMQTFGSKMNKDFQDADNSATGASFISGGIHGDEAPF